MKKIGFIVFIAALFVGLTSALNCSVGSFNLGGESGSGNVQSEKRDVSGFKAIDAGGAIRLDVIVGQDFTVEVEADDNLLSRIKTEVSGSKLKIYTEDRISTKNEMRVRVSMPELTAMDLSGASHGTVSGVNSDSLELDASGASKIIIDGKARTLRAEASGASTLNAENLSVEDADVEASGASNITVNASNDLKADASGASSVVYTGEPKNVKGNSSGASSVKRR